MTGKPHIVRSLEEVSSRYAVFERDQVLTDGQLNSITRYLDDQDRLTRLELLGIGLVGGLHVSRGDAEIHVSQGLGVTSDGDLLILARNTRYDRFRPYDEQAPEYPPFQRDGVRMPLFELLAGDTDTPGQPLSALPGAGLAGMAVVMLMESYEQDHDLCSGTDCDNLGKLAIHTPRLLLVTRADGERLRAGEDGLLTLAAASRALPLLSADRPALGQGIISPGVLVQACRDSCNRTLDRLSSAFERLDGALPGLLAEVFGVSPVSGWQARLTDYRDRFESDGRGIQYYHDFLKDLTETWNPLLELLLDCDDLLCPDPTAFPKHLLLGDLSAPAQLRTGHYPSPLAGGKRLTHEHARFLLRKLGLLINSFELPDEDAIRITPSRSEVAELEERAIPCYYRIGRGPLRIGIEPPEIRVVTDRISLQPERPSPVAIGRIPILLKPGRPVLHQHWSFRLQRRDASRDNLGYRAGEYGGNTQPLQRDLGRHDFFRIEGHIGQKVATAMDRLEDQIRADNLPIRLRAVLLHQDRRHLLIKPAIRYGDLHRLHYVLRRDVAVRLDQSKHFGASLAGQIKTAVSDAAIPNRTANDEPVALLATQHGNALNTAIAGLVQPLSLTRYTASTKDTSWKPGLAVAMNSASQFKLAFANLLRPELATPIDTLVAGSHAHWLDWIELLIDSREQREDDKLQFRHFIRQHPGLEHRAGVTPGGTFVLAYDDRGLVVADFMLPYDCPEIAEDEPDEPELKLPELKPPVLDGIKIMPPLDIYLGSKLQALESKLRPEWERAIDVQKAYNQLLQDSFDVLGPMTDLKTGAAGLPGGPAMTEHVPGMPDTGGGITDPWLGFTLTRLRQQQQQVMALRQMASNPGTSDPIRQQATLLLAQTEKELAASIGAGTHYIAEQKVATSAGTTGAQVVQILGSAMASLGSSEAVGTLQASLDNTLHSVATDAIQQEFVKNMQSAASSRMS